MQLSRDLIADAALRVAARATSDQLKIRDIGAELGCDPTAIYRHFRSRDELLSHLVDRVFDTAYEAFVGDTSLWRARLKRGTDFVVDELIRFPAVAVAAAGDRRIGYHELRLADGVLRTVLESGVSRECGVLLYTAFASFVLSSAGQLARERVADMTGRNGPSTAEGYGRMWLTPFAGADVSATPTLAASWPLVSTMRRRDVLNAGVDALLDAIEYAARAL